MPDSNKINNVCLIGNPNSGKSTLFNILTGLKQNIGNFPGVTVDKKVGRLSLSSGREVNVVDLPGIYSLYPNSSDEKLVVDILCNPKSEHYPDLVVSVVDLNQLEKHLLLVSQIIDLNIPMILVANMVDVFEDNAKTFDQTKLSAELGIPVVTISARKENNVEELLSTIDAWTSDQNTNRPTKGFYQISKQDKEAIAVISQFEEFNTDYQAKVVAHHGSWLSQFTPANQTGIVSKLDAIGFNNVKGQIDETLARFSRIEVLSKDVVSSAEDKEVSKSERLDGILTHRIFGPLLFFGIMLFVFQAIYAWSEAPMTWIEDAFGFLSDQSRNMLPEGWMADLMADGILAGLAGVLVFIPQILILFLLIGILEELGYMSRVVFMFDDILRKFGLNGRSIVALVSGAACAIPAIMSTRTITNWKERLITIMVTPFISCSARIPVYTVLVGFVVPQGQTGPFNNQGLAFMGLYLLGIIAALVAGWVFKQIIQPEGRSFLMIELPTYKAPRWRNVFIDTFEKVWTFIIEAGKIILIISILLWVLATYGPSNSMQAVEVELAEMVESGVITQAQFEDELASKKLEASYIGHIGKAIEPVLRPLGFDWKMSIAVLTSFAAREVFIGTMATIYSIGSTDDESTVREKMAAEINPITGGKRYDAATAFSLLLFYVFAMQCMSTLAVTKRETKSWKWPIIQFVFMTVVAYVAAFIGFTMLS